MLKPLQQNLTAETYTAFIVYYTLLSESKVSDNLLVDTQDNLVVDKTGIQLGFEAIDKSFCSFMYEFGESIPHLLLEAKAALAAVTDWDIQKSMEGLGGCVLHPIEYNLRANGFEFDLQTSRFRLPNV